MAFVPDSKAAPRLYSQHQHYARIARMRYAAQKIAFLKLEATRLSSSETNMFKYLYANSAFKISKVGSTSGLTADPYPATSL